MPARCMLLEAEVEFPEDAVCHGGWPQQAVHAILLLLP